MKRDELIKMLTENYKADDEVVFLFDDDEGEVRAKNINVEDHTETRHTKFHFEFDILGTTYKFYDYVEARNALQFKDYTNAEASRMIRFVPDETVTDTVKVLHITE